MADSPETGWLPDISQSAEHHTRLPAPAAADFEWFFDPAGAELGEMRPEVLQGGGEEERSRWSKFENTVR